MISECPGCGIDLGEYHNGRFFSQNGRKFRIALEEERATAFRCGSCQTLFVPLAPREAAVNQKPGGESVRYAPFPTRYLDEAINVYHACPYTQLSMAGVCDDCQLNQGFVIHNPEGQGQLHTTICRLLEVLENTMAMMKEDTGLK